MMDRKSLEYRHDADQVGLGAGHALSVAIIIAPAIIAAVLMLGVENELHDIIFTSIADAYLQVSTFVAATFSSFTELSAPSIDATAMLEDTVWQVPVLPNRRAPRMWQRHHRGHTICDGAAFFGGVVAALTATMGDAAFLLIAQEPLTGLAMVTLGFVVGTLSGWVINFIHGGDFLRGNHTRADAQIHVERRCIDTSADRLWLLILGPGIVLAGLVAFQFDVDAMFADMLDRQPHFWASSAVCWRSACGLHQVWRQGRCGVLGRRRPCQANDLGHHP